MVNYRIRMSRFGLSSVRDSLGKALIMQVSLAPFTEELEDKAKKLEGIPILGEAVKLVEELGDPEIKASIQATKDIKKDIDKGRKLVERVLGLKERAETHIDNYRDQDTSESVPMARFEIGYGHSGSHFEHGGSISDYAGSNASMIMTQ